MTSNDACPTPGRGVREADRAQRERLAEALAQVAAGNREAFGVFYDGLSPVVYGVAFRVLRDASQAAEITQDVFLDLWRDAATFDPSRGTVFAWASTLTHRRAVDRVRSEQSRRGREDRAALQEPLDLPGVDEQVVEGFEALRVRDCLGTLTELERSSVEDAYYGGRSYREVAERAGAALSTVKSRIRSGLQRLRDCLEVE